MKLNPLDTLFSEFIRKRAIARVGGCEKCLRPKFDIVKENGDIFPAWKQLQCGHFIGRTKKVVRWDEDNAAGLCAGCHRYLDNQSDEKTGWFTGLLGETRIDLLRARARNREKPDIELLTLYYKAEIAKLKNR